MSKQRSSPTVEVLRLAPAARARALATMLLTAFALPAGAADRWFTVEMIVFDDLRGEALHAELWPEDPGQPSLRNAIELTHLPEDAGGDTLHAYRLVNPSGLTLGKVRNSLRRSAHYRPILHAGWRLPGLPRNSARPVHVSRSLVAGTGATAIRAGERPSVHGTVKVSLARFLQVEVDLLYRRPAIGEAAAPAFAPTMFRLVSERRMRSGELHYIDHPLFGVLMLLKPI